MKTNKWFNALIRKNGNFFGLTVLSILLLIMGSCQSDDTENPDGNHRSFYLGFTPFPYDISNEAVEDTYEKLADHSDIINHHFDNGIPWVEALNGAEFSDDLINQWTFRKSETPTNHKIVLALTPINFDRDGLATYWGSEEGMALPSPWEAYSLNHEDVKTAYVNYCKRAIEFFQPDFFLFGIEVNLLIAHDPSLNLWTDYMELHQSTYNQLKTAYPELPISVSFTAPQLLEGYTDDPLQPQLDGLSDIATTTDYYALSLYPYFSKFLTDQVPDNMFDELFSLSNKPIAITETGYPAQSFSVNDESLQFNSNPTKQRDYIEALLDASKDQSMEFIINFVVQDYDMLWEDLGAVNDFTILWRDTGLFDENGEARTALEVWDNQLAVPYSKE